MTTRTHYRNSVLAFPKTAEYGSAITRYATPVRADSCVMYTCAFALFFLSVVLIVEVLV
jgi:hypothetical protein